jgi:protein-L-isoaspartate(D-aspartate) O-methyltransferase
MWVPPEQYIAGLPKATVYGCFFVTDESDHPVQLRSARNPALWQWPGGNMDPGETPWGTAVRECREETGLTLDVEPRLLAVHFLPPLGDWTTHKIGFVFDGGRLTQGQITSIVLDPEEHSDVAVKPLDVWRQEQEPGSFRRLEAVSRARATGITCYLEHADDR